MGHLRVRGRGPGRSHPLLRCCEQVVDSQVPPGQHHRIECFFSTHQVAVEDFQRGWLTPDRSPRQSLRRICMTGIWSDAFRRVVPRRILEQRGCPACRQRAVSVTVQQRGRRIAVESPPCHGRRTDTPARSPLRGPATSSALPSPQRCHEAGVRLVDEHLRPSDAGDHRFEIGQRRGSRTGTSRSTSGVSRPASRRQSGSAQERRHHARPELNAAGYSDSLKCSEVTPSSTPMLRGRLTTHRGLPGRLGRDRACCRRGLPPENGPVAG